MPSKRHRKLVTVTKCTLLPYDHLAGLCARCGKTLIGGQRRWCGGDCQHVYETNHYWPLARAAAQRRDLFRCRRCTSGRALEVNHKIPRNGRGYGPGCHNHLSNLETLCHYHHVEVTRRQRIARSRVKSRRGDQAQEKLAMRLDLVEGRTDLDANPDA